MEPTLALGFIYGQVTALKVAKLSLKQVMPRALQVNAIYEMKGGFLYDLFQKGQN